MTNVTTYTWTGLNGDWSDATHWTQDGEPAAAAPNGDDASVVLDVADLGLSYTVTIQSGETETVGSISLNGQGFPTAHLEIDGTLVFGTGSSGTLQNVSFGNTAIYGGTIVNAGTVEGGIQAFGSVEFLGTNILYLTGPLHAYGVVTLDTSAIGMISGATLDQGLIQADSGGAVRFGGVEGGLVVNIETLAAGPFLGSSLDELIWSGEHSDIEQWDGTQYIGVEQTLREIGAGGVITIETGRDLELANPFLINGGGELSLHQGTLTANQGLTFDGGLFDGTGTIAANVLAQSFNSIHGTLAILGTLSGSGTLNLLSMPAGYPFSAGSTLEVHAVSLGEQISMNGGSTLVLDEPADFLGAIAAAPGDSIVLTGQTVTGAVIQGGSLVISGDSGTLESLQLLGDYSNEHVEWNGSQVTFVTGAPPPIETTYTWITNGSGEWIEPANWELSTGGIGFPNGANADVFIGLNAALPYAVTIAPGDNIIVNSLTLNSTGGAPAWASLMIDGTLAFADGSTGEIAGSQASTINLLGGTIVNVGTVEGMISVNGGGLLAGTNTLHLAGSLEIDSGTLTIDTRDDDQISGTILSGGTYHLTGPSSVLQFGGAAQGMIVNIETIEGSPAVSTQLILDSFGPIIQEWTGDGYIGLQQTLKEIGAQGTVDVLGGLSFGSTNTLTIDAGGLLNLQAHMVLSPGIVIDGGTLQGSAEIFGTLTNDGTLTSEDGTLYVHGDLLGSGQVTFDFDHEALSQTGLGATLELGGQVSAGQTITMNGGDVLRIDRPDLFAGTIAAQVGDQFVLDGINATSAFMREGDLLISDGSGTVSTLHMLGDYSNMHFVTDGSTITVEPGAQPTAYAWANGVSGFWHDPANWITPLGLADAPNSPFADVTIDVAPTSDSYVVTIGADENVIVNTLTLTGQDPANAYNAAELEIDGTLTFADGSAGLLEGAGTHRITMNNGTIVNGGEINGLLAAQGNVLITGTNAFDTPWLQSSGTVTIDTVGLSRLSGTCLLGGNYQALQDSEIDFGGTNLTVDITEIDGSDQDPTTLSLSGTGSSIREWNGTTLVALEDTLQRIGSGATLSVTGSRDYVTSNTLAIDGGVLYLRANNVGFGSLTINSGSVQGFATISGDVENDGTLMALHRTLTLQGTLGGTGIVKFDLGDQYEAGFVSGDVFAPDYQVAATLEVHSVGSGQRILMNGRGDTLVLDSPAQFHGTISAGIGDHIVLAGQAIASATIEAGNLIIGGASGTLATLHLSGDYSAEHFAVDGSTLTLTDGAPTPTPTPTPVSANQLVFQDNDGSVATWQMDGTTVSSFTYRPSPGDGWYLRGTGSFYTGDAADYVWHNENGQVAIWQMQGTTVVSGSVLDNLVTTDWHMKATADFYHTGHSAILWQNDNGSVALWNMNGSTATSYDVLSSPGSDWHVRGAANFYGDGNTDILWQNDSGQIAIWDMDGGSVAKWGVVDNNPGAAWQIKGTGDFYGNGHSDILLQNTNGQIAIWDMNGTTISQMGTVDSNPGSSWHVAGTADVNGDGKADITFKNDDGSVAVWEMNGSTVTAGGWVSNPGSSWNLLGSGDMRFVASTGAGEMLTASPVVAEEFNMATAAAGDHTIMGFNTTQDMLALSAAQFGSFDAVQAATSNTGAGAMIDLGNSTSLLLPGVNPASLHASNFALV